MPERKTILDAFYTALDASTSINHVTKDMTESGWNWDEDQYPGVMVIDVAERKKRFAYSAGSTVADMESVLGIEVTGFVRQLHNDTDDIETKRAALLAEIEKVVMTSTGIDDVTLDITGIEADTDRNVLENIGWVTTRFDVSYIYSHTAP